MTLQELQHAADLPAPQLFPLSGWALGLGLLLILIGLNNVWILISGVLIAGYGVIALATNHNRAKVYREECYRAWVHHHADTLAEEA